MDSVRGEEAVNRPGVSSRPKRARTAPVVRVPWSEPDLSGAERHAVNQVLSSGWLGMGRKTEEFEAGLCEYTGASNAVFVNNGTSALMAAYLANGIGPGDEVIVPTYTFVATVNALTVLGARPVLVDCDPSTLNVDPEIVETACLEHPKAKALVFVDIAGQPCDIDGIREVAARHSLAVIEDAAESFGGACRNRTIGNYDHATVFSFHIAKQLTTVEGGAIVTNDRALATRCRMVRSHGEGPQKYVHLVPGLNFRPTDIQAAIGTVQLAKVNRFLSLRERAARAYRDGVGEWLEFQRVPDFATRVTNMLFVVFGHDGRQRDELNSWLNSHGIDTRLPFPPVHAQPFYSARYGLSTFPGAERAFSRVISLPMGNGITLSQVDTVVDSIRAFFEN